MSATDNPDEEMPYSEDRARHLPASEARLYQSHAGLAPPDAVLWWEKYVGPYTAASSVAAGLSLDDVVREQEAARLSEQADASRRQVRAKEWRELRAKEWQAVGVDASDIAAAQAAGLTPEDVRPWREDRLKIAQLRALVSHGATPEHRAEWLKLGFRLKDVVAELSRDVGVDEISSTSRDRLLWRSIPSSARKSWKALPVNPSDVLVWRTKGLRPIDLLLSGYVDPGVVASGGEIALVVDEDDREHYWLSEPTSLGADQMERLTAIEIGRRSPEFLERFGFKVETWSLRRQEWLDRREAPSELANELARRVVSVGLDGEVDDPIPSEIHRTVHSWEVMTETVDELTGYHGEPIEFTEATSLIEALEIVLCEGPSSIDLDGLKPEEAIELLNLEPLRRSVSLNFPIGSSLRLNGMYCVVENDGIQAEI